MQLTLAALALSSSVSAQLMTLQPVDSDVDHITRRFSPTASTIVTSSNAPGVALIACNVSISDNVPLVAASTLSSLLLDWSDEAVLSGVHVVGDLPRARVAVLATATYKLAIDLEPEPGNDAAQLVIQNALDSAISHLALSVKVSNPVNFPGRNATSLQRAHANINIHCTSAGTKQAEPNIHNNQSHDNECVGMSHTTSSIASGDGAGMSTQLSCSPEFPSPTELTALLRKALKAKDLLDMAKTVVVSEAQLSSLYGMVMLESDGHDIILPQATTSALEHAIAGWERFDYR